jgi:hypothetical protein
LGVTAEFTSLTKRLLSGRGVPHPTANLANLIQRLTDVAKPVEHAELLSTTARGVLCFSPRSAQSEDLCLMDPAVPRRQAHSTSLRCHDPLSSPPVIRDFTARADRVAVHGAGKVGPELTTDRGERSLVDQGQAVGNLPLPHQRHALVHHASRLQIPIP